jgi:hypothetical protein
MRMKTTTFLLLLIVMIGLSYSCKTSAYEHHMVRMVDAKSYMDHPMSKSLYYYH